MIIRSKTPLNAETPLARLRAAFITPEADFYVRSHGNLPRLGEDSHILCVGGLVAKPMNLTVPELRARFAERTVTATLQCAGNRRSELNALRPVSGDLWSAGAIGNAVWTGVALDQVLKETGADRDPALHVVFDAADQIDPSVHYGASIPMTKAADPDVLLAYAMNGKPLAVEHGFPLRVVVPGFAGVRCVKWLTGISVSREPSPSRVQRHDYKLFPPETTKETADWNAGITINEMPLTSAICIPSDQETTKAGPTVISGYAYSYDSAISRVELSSDGGQRWRTADLERRRNARWSWTLWTATAMLAQGEHELVVRAWDDAGRTQPAARDDVWNFKGYLCSAWHRIRIRAA